jgi:hypothetical protein
MTIQELNELIARGANQPGVQDAMDLMQLGEELSRQAQELVDVYGTVSTSAATASSSVFEWPSGR